MAAAILSIAIIAWAGSAVPAERRAVPLDPVVAVVEALKTHEIVALGEGAHGNEQAHAFQLSRREICGSGE
jgi:hypothetical protein